MMKKRIVALCMGMTLFAGNVVYAQKLDLENQFTRPLSDVMNDLSRRFDVKFKYNVDTIGKRLPYADFRIRPYSLEESLTNVCRCSLCLESRTRYMGSYLRCDCRFVRFCI